MHVNILIKKELRRSNQPLVYYLGKSIYPNTTCYYL